VSDSGTIQRLDDQPSSCPAMTAPMRRTMESALGRTCATLALCLVPRFVHPWQSFVRMRLRYSAGKPRQARASASAPSGSEPAPRHRPHGVGRRGGAVRAAVALYDPLREVGPRAQLGNPHRGRAHGGRGPSLPIAVADVGAVLARGVGLRAHGCVHHRLQEHARQLAQVGAPAPVRRDLL
jgi:hypothetical protein